MGLGLWGERTGNFGLSDQADAFGFCLTNPTESTDCDEPRIPFALPFQNGRFPEASYFAERVPARAYAAVGLDNDLANPLHLALVAGAIANGGDVMVPRIVTSVRDAQGRTVREFDEEIASRAITGTTASSMTQMMLSVTQGGTASSAFSGFRDPRGRQDRNRDDRRGTAARTRGSRGSRRPGRARTRASRSPLSSWRAEASVTQRPAARSRRRSHER